MALKVKSVAYYNVTVESHAGAAAQLLSLFANVGISWLAFKAVPAASGCTRFSLFPNDGAKMTAEANRAGLELDGPHAALFIEGDDESGSLADIYQQLAQADIPVGEASGIADIHEGYGVVLYLKQEDCEKAVAALEGVHPT